MMMFGHVCAYVLSRWMMKNVVGVINEGKNLVVLFRNKTHENRIDKMHRQRRFSAVLSFRDDYTLIFIVD